MHSQDTPAAWVLSEMNFYHVAKPLSSAKSVASQFQTRFGRLDEAEPDAALVTAIRTQT